MTESVHHEVNSRTLLGFWIYLMTDCVLFATLFAAYAVLHNNTYGGPTTQELFHMPYALAETIVLLLSSFSAGIAVLGVHTGDKKWILSWFGVTFLLGATFMGLEISEFARLIETGNSWQRNAFLSSFFTLVGTHGLHISFGLIWMVVLLIPVWRHGLTPVNLKRITCLRMFWHFLDIVWIFIFTLVYLIGGQP